MPPLPPCRQSAEAPCIRLVTYDWSTLTEMPYLLKQAGCQEHVLCPADNWTIKNGCYDRWIDTGDSLESLLDKLVTLAQDPGYRYIMIGDDPILWAIYRRCITSLWPLLPVRNEAALPILNKIGFAEHCQRHGIPSSACRSRARRTPRRHCTRWACR